MSAFVLFVLWFTQVVTRRLVVEWQTLKVSLRQAALKLIIQKQQTDQQLQVNSKH